MTNSAQSPLSLILFARCFASDWPGIFVASVQIISRMSQSKGDSASIRRLLSSVGATFIGLSVKGFESGVELVGVELLDVEFGFFLLPDPDGGFSELMDF